MMQAKASGVGWNNIPFDLEDLTAVKDYDTFTLAPVTAVFTVFWEQLLIPKFRLVCKKLQLFYAYQYINFSM